jgi:DNA-binding MarR family transcriptional regulator
MTVEASDAIRLGFLIHDVARLQRAAQDRLLKPLGLTRSQWGVLIFLSRRDGMTQTALAADLDLTKPAVGGLLGRMEVSGLIQRRRDELNARMRRVYLTRAGHRVLGQIQQVIEPVATKPVDQCTDEDVAATLRVLRRMRARELEMVGEDNGVAEEDED